jgi:hypothetical protein
LSVKVEEKFRGRTRSTGRNASAEITYIITATAGETDEQIEAALLAAAPSHYGELVIDGIGYLEPINDRIGKWEGSIRFTQQELVRKDPGSGRITFRTTGGTQHILHSQRTVAPYRRPGQSFIDFKNGIGVQEGGSVTGCDIFVPVFEWVEPHVFAPSVVDTAYISTLYELTGTVNRDPWRVFRINDCLFVGAEGSERDDGNWEIDFHLAAAKTVFIPNIGDIRADNGGPIIKRGWDYLWVHYRDQIITLTGSSEQMRIPIPHQVNIEAVYDEGDFPRLGIGT